VRSQRFRFTIGGEMVRGWHDESTIELPIEWVFGAGTQAVTFVSRVNADWYLEHAFSYYMPLGGFALTPGQDAIRPKDLREASGLLYKRDDPQHGIAGCFQCHATGPVTFDREGTALIAEPGVRCEACHGPGAHHVAGKAKPLNPGRMTAAGLNEFCGRCHRPPASEGVRIDWNYAWNVRHQPVYLSESSCFRKGSGRLSCLTCHDPHLPLNTNASFYSNKCGTCHASKPAACSSNCVDCHMPRVSPQTGLRFTNHWIGVYAEGSRLKPLRR
jgi:hypothetical protein